VANSGHESVQEVLIPETLLGHLADGYDGKYINTCVFDFIHGRRSSSSQDVCSTSNTFKGWIRVSFLIIIRVINEVINTTYVCYKYVNTEIQKFRNSEIQKFRNSGIQDGT
jgi:hypothetical protein